MNESGRHLKREAQNEQNKNIGKTESQKLREKHRNLETE